MDQRPPSKSFVLQRLAELSVPDNAIRDQADHFIQGFRQRPGFVPILLQILQDRSVSCPTRHLSSILLKNFILDFWSTFPLLSDRKAYHNQIMTVFCSCHPSEHQIFRMLGLGLTRVLMVESGEYGMTGRQPGAWNQPWNSDGHGPGPGLPGGPPPRPPPGGGGGAIPVDRNFVSRIITTIGRFLLSKRTPSEIFAGLYGFLSLLRLYMWTDRNRHQHDRLSQIIRSIIPHCLTLYAFITNLQKKSTSSESPSDGSIPSSSTPPTTTSLLCVMQKYLLVKIFHSTMNKYGGVYEFMATQPSNFETLMRLFAFDVMTPFPIPRLPQGVRLSQAVGTTGGDGTGGTGRPSPLLLLRYSVKVKKWIITTMRRLTTLYSLPQTGTPVLLTEPHIAFGRVFLGPGGGAIRFLEVVLNRFLVRGRGVAPPNQSDLGTVGMRRLIVLTHYYLQSCCLNVPQIFQRVVVPRLQQLLFGVLLPYLSFRDYEDSRMWKEDDREYSVVNFDVPELFFGSHDTKGATCMTIKLLVAEYSDIVLPVIMENLSKVIMDPRVPPQTLDGALYLLGNLSTILQEKASDRMAPLLVDHVLPKCISSPLPYLRAKLCWLLGSFSGCNWRTRANLSKCVGILVGAFRDSEVIVQIRAAVSLTDFLRYDSVVQEIECQLSPILQSMVQLLGRTNDDALVASLEIIVDVMKERVLPFAVDIMRHLMNTFLRYYGAYDMDDEHGFPAFSHFHTMVRLVDIIQSIPVVTTFGQMLLPILRRMLSEEKGQEFIEDVLMMITSLSYKLGKAGQFPRELWVLFPLFMTLFDTLGYMIANLWVAPIDNYVSYSHQIFMSDRRNMESVIGYARKLMLDDERSIGHEKMTLGAVEVISLLLHHCKGEIDQIVPTLLEMVLFRLKLGITSEALKILMADAIADHFSYNPLLTLRILTAQSAVERVFPFWLDTISVFYRIFDRRVSIFGFTALLHAAASQDLPPIVMGNLPKIVGAILFLIRANTAQKQRVTNPTPLEVGIQAEIVRTIREGDLSHLKESQHYQEFIKEIHAIGDETVIDRLEEDVCLESPLLSQNEVELFRASIRNLVSSRGKPWVDEKIFVKLSPQDKQMFSSLLS